MKHEPPPDFVIRESGDDGFCADQRSGRLRIIASWGMGWEHVSVSHRQRVPLYDEMAYIAKWFWPDHYAMQFHVPAHEHINCHPYCLHWWRPTEATIPVPPSEMVGPRPNQIVIL